MKTETLNYYHNTETQLGVFLIYYRVKPIQATMKNPGVAGGLYSLTSMTKDELINTEMNAILKCSLDR